MYDIRDIQLKSVRRNHLPKVTKADKYVSAVFMFVTFATVLVISVRLIIQL